MNAITHLIRNPSGVKLIVAMALLSWMLLRDVMELNASSGVIRSVITIAILLCSSTVLFVTAYRALQKPTELRMDGGTVLLNGRSLQAEEIQVIMRMGYFWPLIGIKPYGKRIVPIPFCFRFAKDEDHGVDDLMKWAEDHEVKMTRKSFVRWL